MNQLDKEKLNGLNPQDQVIVLKHLLEMKDERIQELEAIVATVQAFVQVFWKTYGDRPGCAGCFVGEVRQIEKALAALEGCRGTKAPVKCTYCNGKGTIDLPGGDAPEICPNCGGAGVIESEGGET